MRLFGLALVTAVLSFAQGVKEVAYEVDGTAKYANLTLTNKDGGTEQKQAKLPFEVRFYARAGQFLYLSAGDFSPITRGYLPERPERYTTARRAY